jgi:hypothetical protein
METAHTSEGRTHSPETMWKVLPLLSPLLLERNVKAENSVKIEIK